MSRLPLRPYQREANEAVRAAWAGGMRRPAVVLPTGTGKTVAFTELANEVVTGAVPGIEASRVLILAHRAELIDQAAAKMRAVAPARRVGIVKADRDEVGADIVIGSVQTLRSKRRRDRVRNVGMIVVDECHHGMAPTYLDILGHYGVLDETTGPFGRRAVAVGYTATMSRGDGLGLGEVWEDVVYTRSLAASIRDGFLVEPRGIAVHVEDLDLDTVKRSRGDYQDGALGVALAESMAPQRIVDAYREHASDRPGFLFAPTVEFAQIMVDAFNAAGFVADIVHGAQTADERAAAWAGFDSGKTQIICNCMVATEGTDKPHASCVVIARPTTHHGLYVQMVGRVLRPYPGKSDALVLDVSGASKRHALTSVVDLIGLEDAAEHSDDEAIDLAGALGEELSDLGESGGVERVYRDGRLVSEEIDLFHGSRLAWLQTHGGLWFLPVGNRYIVICAGAVPGTYDVAAVDSWIGGGGRWISRGLPDMSYAMAFGEADVSDHEMDTVARDAKFRSRALNRADEKRMRRLYGVKPANVGEMRRIEVIHHASSRLDVPGVRH